MKKMLRPLFLLQSAAILFCSFAFAPGGEGFEIFLNNKVIVQQFGTEKKNVIKLDLSAAAPSDQLTLKYYHCGKAGKNRVITLRDNKNNVLKTFSFKDDTNPVAAMQVRVKEILDAEKGKSQVISLYYTSSELPQGRMLVALQTKAVLTARL